MSGRPISILFGTDAEALDILLPIHGNGGPIVDVTHNRGVMWKRSTYAPDRRFDVAPPAGAGVEQADCRALPLNDASVGAIIFDPPHLPAAAASAGSSGIERDQYGLTGEHDYMQGENIAPLFGAFLTEASRVLMPGGVVLAKLSDHVHNHRYQWVHEQYLAAVRAAGLTPCDLLILCHPAASNLKSSKWVNVRHLRRGHCFWIVARKGGCEAKRPPADHNNEVAA